MSDQLYAVEVKSIDGWHMAEDGRVLVKCNTAKGEFVMSLDKKDLAELAFCLLDAFAETQKPDGRARQSVTVLEAAGYDIGGTTDGSLVLTLQKKGGAGIPFQLTRDMAKGLSDSLEERLDNDALMPSRTQSH